MFANFLLGTLQISEDAKLKLHRIPYDLVARHAVNEHGKITRKEYAANYEAMQTVGNIMSRYMVDPTDPTKGNVIIVTHKAWGETLIRLEHEA